MLQLVWGWEPALYLFLGGLGSGAFVTAALLHFYRRDSNRLLFCVSAWAAVVCIVFGLILLITDLIEPLRGLMMWQSFIHPTSWMVWGAWGLFGATIIFGVTALLLTLQIVNPPWRFLLSKSEKETLASGGTLSSGKDAPNAAMAVDGSGAAIASGAKVSEIVRSPSLPERLEKPINILSIIGIPFGLFVGFYTGLLLMAAPGIPFWNTIALPFLFLVSAVDTGVALVELLSVILMRKDPINEDSHKFVVKFTVINVIIELGIMAIFLGMAAAGNPVTAVGYGVTTAAHDSTMMLIGDPFGGLFWPVVIGLGLVLPLAINVSTLIISRKKGEFEPATAKSSMIKTLIASLGVLIGGCMLRFLVLYAGMHPDIVMDTFKALIM